MFPGYAPIPELYWSDPIIDTKVPLLISMIVFCFEYQYCYSYYQYCIDQYDCYRYRVGQLCSSMCFFISNICVVNSNWSKRSFSCELDDYSRCSETYWKLWRISLFNDLIGAAAVQVRICFGAESAQVNINDFKRQPVWTIPVSIFIVFQSLSTQWFRYRERAASVILRYRYTHVAWIYPQPYRYR